MDDPVSRTAPEPKPPRPARGRVLWPGLAMLALLLVVGAAWTRGPGDAASPQPTATVQPMDMSGMDMGAQPMVEHQADGHTEQMAHETGESQGVAHEETSAPATVQPMDDMSGMDMGAQPMVEHQADGHTEQMAHEETSAPAAHEAHGQAGDHEEAPPLSPAIKQVVLSGFAGVNLMAIAAAAFLRRRTHPRLPKHLARVQPKRESSLP